MPAPTTAAEADIPTASIRLAAHRRTDAIRARLWAGADCTCDAPAGTRFRETDHRAGDSVMPEHRNGVGPSNSCPLSPSHRPKRSSEARA